MPIEGRCAPSMAQMISYGVAIAAAALLFGGVLQAEGRKLTQDQPFVTPIACDVLIIGGGPVRKQTGGFSCRVTCTALT